MDDYTDLLAYFGGSLLGVQLIPQIYKIYKSKSSEDISQLFLHLNIAGLALMTSYGVINNDKPLYIPTCISLCNSSILSLLSFLYKSKKQREESKGCDANEAC